MGITDLHDELRLLLGRLKYRTSYGQNVLKHLVECAHIAGLMAAELGMNPTTVKRAAFLHDIGKALTHEVEGSHAVVGAEYARRFGESEDVAHAIEAHHNEVQPQTVEAVLKQAADACSGGRPGARRESLEVYVKRLERIEEIATAKEGVDRVFAMQAGREVRVMVRPESVDDLGHYGEGDREADRGRADVPRSDQGDGGARVTRDRGCALKARTLIGVSRTYEVRTFGCQMNSHDSERISGLLEAAGYRRDTDGRPDVVVFNTCAVRENATTACTETSVTFGR